MEKINIFEDSCYLEVIKNHQIQGQNPSQKLMSNFDRFGDPFWVDLGSILRPFLDDFGSKNGGPLAFLGCRRLRRSREGPGSALGGFWVVPGTVRARSGIVPGPILGPNWRHFASNLGPHGPKVGQKWSRNEPKIDRSLAFHFLVTFWLIFRWFVGQKFDVSLMLFCSWFQQQQLVEHIRNHWKNGVFNDCPVSEMPNPCKNDGNGHMPEFGCLRWNCLRTKLRCFNQRGGGGPMQG